MPLDHRLSEQGDQIVLHLTGSFTLKENGVFKNVLNDLVGRSPKTVVVDMGGVDAVDSAGLSMLVVLRNRLAPNGGTVMLRQPPEHVRKLIEVVHLQQLLPIA